MENPQTILNVCKIVSNDTGIPAQTLDKWYRSRKAIDSLYKVQQQTRNRRNRMTRKKKIRNSKSKVFFPQTERILTEEIRKAIQSHRRYISNMRN
jgi:hypothetical protein